MSNTSPLNVKSLEELEELPCWRLNLPVALFTTITDPGETRNHVLCVCVLFPSGTESNRLSTHSTFSFSSGTEPDIEVNELYQHSNAGNGNVLLPSDSCVITGCWYSTSFFMMNSPMTLAAKALTYRLFCR